MPTILEELELGGLGGRCEREERGEHNECEFVHHLSSVCVKGVDEMVETSPCKRAYIPPSQ
jgi:hypothetical protein